MYPAIIKAKKTPSLIESLDKFRKGVHKMAIGRGFYRHTGWPPRDVVCISKDFGPLGRNVFVMNRILPNGHIREPTLVICCGKKPVLMFNRSQFESLLSHLPWIKTQLNNQYKLL